MVKSNKKYTDIINTAKNLFWKHGFKRVSIEEICQKANVSKMTYYKHFPNKFELAKVIFNDVVEKGEKQFREIMTSDDPPDEKVRKVMLMKIESTKDISPEFMQDFYTDREPELKAYVEQRTREAWNVLKDDYKKAQEEGVFRKDIHIELLIKVQYKLFDLIEEDEDVNNMFDSKQEMIMEFANLLIYGMIPH
jgi:AcrR family transcriptional regulator